MSDMETLVNLTEERAEEQFEIIQHDHGSLRDGPCYGCEALKIGGVEIACPTCNSSDKPKVQGNIDCCQCGGNFYIVKASEGTRTAISVAEEADFLALRFGIKLQ